MQQLFVNKTVLITGASSGFGECMAKEFAKLGANIIAIARRKERLDQLANHLQEHYKTKVHLLALDISDPKAVDKALDSLPELFQFPEILINNAGFVKGLNKIWETPLDDYNEMIDTNVKGLLNVSSKIIPKMLEKNRGHIINVGSISGHETYAGGGVYCATKHAVAAITDTLRKELVSTPIRVSLISPGMAKTEFSLVRFFGDERRAESVYENIKPLTALDVTEIVLFMASRPPHVTIADVIVYPTHQASVTLIHREENIQKST